jgi:hypothetical protein
MVSNFWTGGPDAYHAGLRREYLARLAALRRRLRECDDLLEREAIRDEIQATEREYKEAVGRIDKQVFRAAVVFFG